MKKIRINEDVKVGNVILEKGDVIEINERVMGISQHIHKWQDLMESLFSAATAAALQVEKLDINRDVNIGYRWYYPEQSHRISVIHDVELDSSMRDKLDQMLDHIRRKNTDLQITLVDEIDIKIDKI